MRRHAPLLAIALTGCISTAAVGTTLARVEPAVQALPVDVARACAPADLARAQGHTELAKLEGRQGRPARAAEHLELADLALARVQASLATCPQAQAAEPGAEPEPAPEPEPASVPERAPPADPEPVVAACPTPTDPRVPTGPDGCPLPDRDGDGIPDELDRCPDSPETFNDYLDHDGCPDVAPTGLRIRADRIELLEPVAFADGTTELRDGLGPLQDLVRLLGEAPDLVVEVHVHTEALETPELALALSQDRAEALVAHLVGLGADPTQIRPIGFGSERPIDTNRTEAGRRRNRRVEVLILRGLP